MWFLIPLWLSVPGVVSDEYLKCLYKMAAPCDCLRYL